jgi:FkbM family methyltransferase
MFHFFKSTKFKLIIANILYKILKIFHFNDHQLVKRSEVTFELDLKEGIDLSLFLFGSFQKHVWRNKLISLPNDPIIIDVGANIGSISLYFAKEFPNSKIYAFEPTFFAFQKLSKNISLNPNLKSRIHPIQAFLSKEDGQTNVPEVYSSWRIDSLNGDHPLHGGILQKVIEKQISLDSFVVENQISQIDLIKVDVDGFEYDVLQGAIETISSLKPIIIFELMGHTGLNLKNEFLKFHEFFSNQNYKLYDSYSEKIINLSNVEKIIPKYGGVDIVAVFEN